jgi:hypothetical protein
MHRRQQAGAGATGDFHGANLQSCAAEIAFFICEENGKCIGVGSAP